MLTVPAAVATLRLDHVLIAWKDTREARRAVADALPLLQQAADVAVVEITDEGDELQAAHRHVADVVRWLERHGVRALGTAQASAGNDAATLRALCRERHAEVIVAGAYGHSRMRESVLGGVTRDLLLDAAVCTLVSH